MVLALLESSIAIMQPGCLCQPLDSRRESIRFIRDSSALFQVGGLEEQMTRRGWWWQVKRNSELE